MDSINLIVSELRGIGIRKNENISLLRLRIELNQLKEDYHNAIESSKLLLKVGQENIDIRTQIIASELLYKNYKKIGNNTKALTFFEQHQILEDSLDKENALQELQKIEFQKKIFTDSIATVEKRLLMEIAHKEEVIKKVRGNIS